MIENFILLSRTYYCKFIISNIEVETTDLSEMITNESCVSGYTIDFYVTSDKYKS